MRATPNGALGTGRSYVLHADLQLATQLADSLRIVPEVILADVATKNSGWGPIVALG